MLVPCSLPPRRVVAAHEAANPCSASPELTQGEDRRRAHFVFLVLEPFQQRGHRAVLEHLGPGPRAASQHARAVCEHKHR